MSDQPEDQNGTAEEVTGEPLAAWTEQADGPAWSRIAAEAEPAAPGSAEPGAAPAEASTEAQPGAQTERPRRPTSLRDRYVKDSDSVPRRKLEAPPFAGAPAFPGSPLTPRVSEAAQPGNPGDVPKPASLLGKLPTDKLPLHKLPVDKISADKLSVLRLRTLTRQRPEVGLGLAFAGGLVTATILKRLGRR